MAQPCKKLRKNRSYKVIQIRANFLTILVSYTISYVCTIFSSEVKWLFLDWIHSLGLDPFTWIGYVHLDWIHSLGSDLFA